MTARSSVPHGAFATVRHVGSWLLAATAVALAVGVGFARFEMHMDTAAVLTGSMRPTYSPGDAVITRPFPVTALRPGMIVLAVPPGQTTPFAHRVVSVAHRGSMVIVHTKGDANPAADDWTDAFAGPTVQRVVAVIPKFGYLLAGFQGRSDGPRGSPILLAGLLVTALATALVLVTAPARPVTPVTVLP